MGSIRVIVLLALWGLSACGPAGPAQEISNPHRFRMMALIEGEGDANLFEREAATFTCIDWVYPYGTSADAVDAADGWGDTSVSCGPECSSTYDAYRECRVYVLESHNGPRIVFRGKAALRTGKRFPASNSDIELWYKDQLGSGWVEFTRVGTTYSNWGDYYVDIAGAFEATFGDTSFRKGLFFAETD
jgi:hypothetical protein